MSRDKQIEEMAELERLLRIRRMDIEKQGCDIWALIKKTESEEQSIANYLIGHGYRKTSDVAREIFEEIEENLNDLVAYYKEKRKYVTEIEYSELEQRYCDIKIKTFEERLLKMSKLKKKYIKEENHI